MAPEPSSQPGTALDLDALLEPLHLSPAEQMAWLACARRVLAETNGGPLLPRHVEAAVERVLATPGADTQHVGRLREVGRTLLAAVRAAHPPEPPPPPPPRRGSGSRLTMAVVCGGALLVLLVVLFAPQHTRQVGTSATRSVPHPATSAQASGASHPSSPDILVANASSPGEQLDLDVLAVPGKTTVIEFFSPHCGPCGEMDRVMHYLAQRREELAVRQVNIDRPGASGIDWDSPLAEQHAIHSVPGFRIYDSAGIVIATGDAARSKVTQWYQEEQLAERADQHPEISGPYRKRD